MSDSGNVIHLPRARQLRPTPTGFGLYLRVGHNQHCELLEVLGSGEKNFHGIVINAGDIHRHQELRSRALQAGLDVVLDPKSHAMALPGSYTPKMGELPWGNDRPHTYMDFEGQLGADKVLSLAETIEANRFTQVLSLTHLLNSANDKWLRRDIEITARLRDVLDNLSSSAGLIYPLGMPMEVLRDRLQRAAIIGALADAPMDAIWLRIENFGSDATGEKTVAFIEAARDFHALGVPVIADHVGGLSGMGALAFGAVGGLAHGLTFLEKFDTGGWRNPPKGRQGGGGHSTRVYIQRLDMFMKKEDAKAFFDSSSRTHGRFGCRDTHCCPGGVNDMVSNPMKHFVHQRSNAVSDLATVPASIRVQNYIERQVRAVSDDVAAASGLGAIDDALKKKLVNRNTALGRFRSAISHFADIDKMASAALVPLTRSERSQVD